jgi:hypothetical protein
MQGLSTGADISKKKKKRKTKEKKEEKRKKKRDIWIVCRSGQAFNALSVAAFSLFSTSGIPTINVAKQATSHGKSLSGMRNQAELLHPRSSLDPMHARGNRTPTLGYPSWFTNTTDARLAAQEGGRHNSRSEGVETKLTDQRLICHQGGSALS